MAYDPLLGCLIEDIAYIEACRAGPEKLRRKNKKWRKLMILRRVIRSLLLPCLCALTLLVQSEGNFTLFMCINPISAIGG